ncbi:hypothetical protein Hdeb2414_s0013g00417401 [Helianthus debilis subsp. tardiflorus]
MRWYIHLKNHRRVSTLLLFDCKAREKVYGPSPFKKSPPKQPRVSNTSIVTPLLSYINHTQPNTQHRLVSVIIIIFFFFFFRSI